MHLDFAPYSQHGRYIRQRREQRLLDGKARQRLFACRAMFAHTGLLHDPFAQLPVGIGQVTKRAQRHEGLLDVFDTRFDDAFLLRVVRRTCIDPETVSLSERLRRNAGPPGCTCRPW